MGIKVRIEITEDDDIGDSGRTRHVAEAEDTKGAAAHRLGTLMAEALVAAVRRVGDLDGTWADGLWVGLDAREAKELWTKHQNMAAGEDDEVFESGLEVTDAAVSRLRNEVRELQAELQAVRGDIPDPQETGNASYATVGEVRRELLRFRDSDTIRLSLDVSQHGDTPEEAGKRVFGELIHAVLQSSVNECTLIADGEFNYDEEPNDDPTDADQTA